MLNSSVKILRTDTYSDLIRKKEKNLWNVFFLSLNQSITIGKWCIRYGANQTNRWINHPLSVWTRNKQRQISMFHYMQQKSTFVTYTFRKYFFEKRRLRSISVVFFFFKFSKRTSSKYMYSFNPIHSGGVFVC